MPKLSFKQKSADESAPLSSYIPTQMVDYTSLPPIEEETAMTRFRQLPVIARIVALLLPLLLLAGAGWGVWTYLAPPAPPAQAHVPPPAQITAIKARAVSGDSVNIELTIENLPAETTASAQLVAAGQPIEWIDAEKNAEAVKNGAQKLRFRKAAGAVVVLDPAAPYTVELTIDNAGSPLTAQTELEVPEMVKAAFFAAPVAEASPSPTPSPTPEPTPSPTPEPTPEPSTPAGPPTLEVALDATLLISPTLGTESVASVAAGTTFEPLLRTGDNAWFLVAQGEQVGWLAADAAKIDAATSEQVKLVRPAAAAVTAGPYLGTVGNGGNIRYRPNVKTGTVLGQLHAGQAITLVAQTVDGAWFKVVAPEAEGWVSVTLLTVEEDVLAQVPVAK